MVAVFVLLGTLGICAAEEFKIGGSGTAIGTMKLLAEAFSAKYPDSRITVAPSLGSGGGIKAVFSGAIGIAVTARPLSASERKLGLVEAEYARTPFVFAVSAKSKLTAITSTDLAQIYAGKVTTWPDGSTLRVILRPPVEIDTEMVKSISPEVARSLSEAMARPGMPVFATDQLAADAVERIPGAIGPSSLAVIVSEKFALRALSLDGKEPTLTNAVSGTYPYYKRLFFVTRSQRSAAVERFIAFVQAPEGRKILESNGQWIP